MTAPGKRTYAVVVFKYGDGCYCMEKEYACRMTPDGVRDDLTTRLSDSGFPCVRHDLMTVIYCKSADDMHCTVRRYVGECMAEIIWLPETI